MREERHKTKEVGRLAGQPLMIARGILPSASSPAPVDLFAGAGLFCSAAKQGHAPYFAGMAIFLAAAGFLWAAGCSGLRGSAFTSAGTGVVPATSAEKVAPEGTR